ncbi:TPA: hypothetical protein ACHICQ_005021 [Enterobacter roggenkampii]|nr:hypothetical protein [Enterobacter roggenkampii]
MNKVALLSLKVTGVMFVLFLISNHMDDGDISDITMLFGLITFISVLPAVWVGFLSTLVASINFVKGGIK